MAKFSSDCLIKLGQVLNKMADKFGPETRELNMRIGIHSGEVTAGVLRGERARFQLFGDTVNTAARMESNGVAGRIQCSQATADKLLAANKASWLKLRKEAVNAKGKGAMRTYFVEPHKSRTNQSSGDFHDDLRDITPPTSQNLKNDDITPPTSRHLHDDDISPSS